MINLLPQNEKILIQKEYRLRLLAVWLIFIFIGTLICLVLLTPSFVLSLYELDVQNQFTTKEPNQPVGANPQAVLATADSLLAALTPASSSVPTMPSAIIDLINGDRNGNTITSFLFSQNASNTPVVTIQGTAQSRDSLLAMSRALQQESAVAAVDLPVSDLAMDSNIPFSIEVTINE